MPVTCEFGNGLWGCIIWGELLDWLRTCQLFGKDKDPCS